MAEIKDILLNLQRQLQEHLPQLKYCDKNWGQLTYVPAAVTFPCALFDFAVVNSTQQGLGMQLDDTEIRVVIANQRLHSSSFSSPDKSASYETVGLVEEVRAFLHGFKDMADTFSDLVFVSCRPIYAESAEEIYQLTFKTAYNVGSPKTRRTLKPFRPELETDVQPTTSMKE